MNELVYRIAVWPQIRGKFSSSSMGLAFGPFPSVRINEVAAFQGSGLEREFTVFPMGSVFTFISSWRLQSMLYLIGPPAFVSTRPSCKQETEPANKLFHEATVQDCSLSGRGQDTEKGVTR